MPVPDLLDGVRRQHSNGVYCLVIQVIPGECCHVRVALSMLGGARQPRQEATHRFDVIGSPRASTIDKGSDLGNAARSASPSSILTTAAALLVPLSASQVTSILRRDETATSAGA